MSDKFLKKIAEHVACSWFWNLPSERIDELRHKYNYNHVGKDEVMQIYGAEFDCM